MRRRRALGAALLALVPLAAGCAGGATGMTPSASTPSTFIGWERWLRVDWKAQGRDIDGYVYSNYGAAICEVRMLALALDDAGNVVGHTLAWMPGVVPGLQRAYFRISGVPPAASYRVSVWSFEIIEQRGFL